MAILGTKALIPVRQAVLGTLGAADGLDADTIQFDGYIWRVKMTLGANGSSSGSTDIVIERTSAAGVTADLWTIGTGIGRMAHDSSALYLEWDWQHSGWTGYSATQLVPPTGARVKKGDLLKLNIDAVPGSASADLTVTLWIYPTAD
jgi:hypothetical protein